jgi:hypothetical protein
MKHIKLFEKGKELNTSIAGFAKGFFGVKIWPKDSETLKLITTAKERKMFLLASHSGVKYYVNDSQTDSDAFKKAVELL